MLSAHDIPLAKKGKRCPHLPGADEEGRMLDMRDAILVNSLKLPVIIEIELGGQATPKDIEDLKTLGEHMHTCPYFGARRAIAQAEVRENLASAEETEVLIDGKLVTLPYNLLLSRVAREALGIDLKDQIIVIDEAHSE